MASIRGALSEAMSDVTPLASVALGSAAMPRRDRSATHRMEGRALSMLRKVRRP